MGSSFLMVSVMVVGGLLAPTVEAGAELVDPFALHEAGISRYWQARVPMEAGDTIERIELLDDTLYVVTDGGSVFALTAETGLVRWGASITAAAYPILPISHLRTADGTGPTIIPTVTGVLLFDRYSGERLHTFSFPVRVGGRILGTRDALYFGGAKGRFYAYRLLGHGKAAELFKAWEAMSWGAVTASPVFLDERTLVFASEGGFVFACRADDKALVWMARTAAPITADPAVDEHGVYVASLDRSLYKLHPTTGRVVWQRQFPDPLEEGPIVIGDTVYQWSPHAGMTTLDAKTGAVRWVCEPGRVLTSHTAGGDWILTKDRRFAVVDHDRGEVKQTIAVPDVDGAVSNPRTDFAYLFNRDGRVVCLKSDGATYLKRQQILAARRLLQKPPPPVQTAPVEKASANPPPQRRLRDPFRSRLDGGR
ncbi:MAG: hypothetical protein D6788_10725 [Planctomycetota bacterium]|nr:MAG: hypothetical protein D6788_10725 [Planctomycetota bacterium]